MVHFENDPHIRLLPSCSNAGLTKALRRRQIDVCGGGATAGKFPMPMIGRVGAELLIHGRLERIRDLELGGALGAGL